MASNFGRLKPRKLSLTASISLAFACSLIPVLLFMISFSYRSNARALRELTGEHSERARRDAIAAMEELMRPVASILSVTAEVAASDPAFFRSERSRDYMHKALVSAPQIDALYTSFEDGYHRVVTRVDDVRRRNDPKIPREARWHSSWIGAFTGAPKRFRHRTFFSDWGKVVKRYDADAPVDIRRQPNYVGAKTTRALFVADPIVNPDTNGPVIAMAYPIVRDGRFLGMASAHITFDILSRYLVEHRVTPRSLTLVLDADGRVLAHPDPSKAVEVVDGKLSLARAENLKEAGFGDLARERRSRPFDRAVYRAGSEEWVASFTPFPDSFGKRWEVVTLTPTDDFLGGLKSSNRRLAGIMLLFVGFELVLIFTISRRLAGPIHHLSEELHRLRTLAFEARDRRRHSPIREVAQLEKGLELLETSLKSFSAFVPLGVVRRLVSSGKPLAQGVESRRLAVLFADLTDFTTLCESLPPDEVSAQLSEYFEAATSAIAQEGGTVDKFIGDAVMAFWGAPAAVDHPAERACRAALRLARRMEKLNERWAAEGRPAMRVRIGLHMGEALVGNIGSSERLSYTAIGDAVNVAARLEQLNKDFGTTICLSETLHDAVEKRVESRALETVKIRGREGRMKIYALLGMKGAAETELASA